MKLRLLPLLSLFCACALAHADVITGVAFSGSPADPTITIFGSGFGAPPTPTTLAYPGYTGYDFGDALYFRDTSLDTGFEAGRGENSPIRDFIGLDLLSYTDDEIIYKFGSTYADYYYPIGLYQLKNGDSFFLHTDADYTGTVQYNVASTPEPPSWSLLCLGGALLAVAIGPKRRETNP